jgi:hypothetical protein
MTCAGGGCEQVAKCRAFTLEEYRFLDGFRLEEYRFLDGFWLLEE